MLKVDGGAVLIRGHKIDLLSEFAQLVNNLRVKEIFSDDDIQMCIEVASMTQEELVAKTKELENKAKLHFLDELEKDAKKSE